MSNPTDKQVDEAVEVANGYLAHFLQNNSNVRPTAIFRFPIRSIGVIEDRR